MQCDTLSCNKKVENLVGRFVPAYTVSAPIRANQGTGQMATNPKEVQITLRIPGELAKALDKHADRTRTTRSWVIRDALHRYFDTLNGQGSSNGNPKNGRG
jgi:hypothetical protein